MRKKNLFFLLFISLFFCHTEANAKTIHAILVADSARELSFATSLKNMQKELKVIAQQTQSLLKEKVFSGSDFQKGKVENYLRNLGVNPSDTVIFYFSGHGYRLRQKTTPWPHLNFEFYKPGIDLKWVADTIRNKKPQFTLVMADCCNNFIEKGFVGKEKWITLNLQHQQPYYPGYKQLFLHAKGCIVVCSAGIGQFAYGSHKGGVFTQCFFASLNRETIEKTPSWKSLLERTSSYIGRIQKPVCEVYH